MESKKFVYVFGGLVIVAALVIGSTWAMKKDDASAPQNLEVVKRAESVYSKTRAKEASTYVTVVKYTSTGFEPAIVSINRGEEVKFVNKSSIGMRIVSNEFEHIPLYPGFSQSKSVGRDGVYQMHFTVPGVWGYHNLDSGHPEVIGIVYVK